MKYLIQKPGHILSIRIERYSKPEKMIGLFMAGPKNQGLRWNPDFIVKNIWLHCYPLFSIHCCDQKWAIDKKGKFKPGRSIWASASRR